MGPHFMSFLFFKFFLINFMTTKTRRLGIKYFKYSTLAGITGPAGSHLIKRCRNREENSKKFPLICFTITNFV